MFWTDFAIVTLLIVYVIVCGLMGLVIMMQRSKQEGLGAAFGGGFTESVWGAQTSQVLVKATVILAALFFILSITLARLYNHREAVTAKSGNSIQQELLKPVAPATTAPAPSATNAAPIGDNTPASTAPAPANNPAPTAPVTPTPAKAPAK